MSKKQIFFLCISIFFISTLGYIIGRLLFPQIITDDAWDYFLWISGLAFIYLTGYGISKISLKFRRIFNVLSGFIIIIFASFGIWGIFSEQGNKVFSEMAGLIPFYVLIFAGILALIFLFINGVWFFRKKNS
ncbi:MAG: hypothetical protein WBP45_07760 [Daejeonella sp.]